MPLSVRLVLESERGCVVLGVSAIEDVLAALLWRYLWMVRWRNSFGNAPENEMQSKKFEKLMKGLFQGSQLPLLGSFWSKLTMCRALGLVGAEDYEILLGLKELRNKFAHAPYVVELSNENITCLGVGETLQDDLDGYFSPPPDWQTLLSHSESKSFSTARKRFVALCTMMHDIISNRRGFHAQRAVRSLEAYRQTVPTTPLPPLE